MSDSNIPTGLKYTKDHEWAKIISPGVVLVGITDYAQKSLGDIVYIELPDTGKEFSKGDTFGVVESVKAASDLYSPASGKVSKNNDKLKATPEIVNRDPYNEGWMMELEAVNENDLTDLMDAKEYGNFLASIDHD